jgi:hypothetical protein
MKYPAFTFDELILLLNTVGVSFFVKKLTLLDHTYLPATISIVDNNVFLEFDGFRTTLNRENYQEGSIFYNVNAKPVRGYHEFSCRKQFLNFFSFSDGLIKTVSDYNRFDVDMAVYFENLYCAEKKEFYEKRNVESKN